MKKQEHQNFIPVIVTAFSVIVVFLLINYFSGRSDRFFTSFIIVGNPLEYVYLDRKENRMITVTIPTDIWIESPHAYGWYPLSSLWELGKIDKKGGNVLTRSFAMAFSLPVDAYIYRHDSGPDLMPDYQQPLDEVFGSGFLRALLQGKIESNLNRVEILSLYRTFRFNLPKKTQNFRIFDLPYITSEIQADDSISKKLRHESLSLLFGPVFELTEIRKEGYTVSVENGSDAVGLALRVGSLLERIGINLTDVKTRTAPLVSACIVSMKADYTGTRTFAVIRHLFSCDTEIRPESLTDFVISIGEEYASQIRS